MKTFKQHLNALEKQRKLEKTSSPKDGVMPVYVHGRHAAEPIDNSFPNYVHGRHASNKINEKANDDNIIDFGDNMVEPPEKLSSSNRSTKRPPKQESSDTTEKEPTVLRDWFNYYNGNVNDRKGIDSLSEELKDHYHPHLDDHADKDHVLDYTKSSSSFNRALIRSHKSGVSDIEPSSALNEYTAERYNKRKDGIDRAITSIPAPKDFDTFSGLGFDPRHHMDENNVMHSPAYLSSSIDPRIAHTFAAELDSKTGKSPESYDVDIEKHMLRIPIRKSQTNGAYVDSISNFGTKDGNTGEREFLHARGQKFKINPYPQTLTGYGNQKHHIWTATPIED